MPLPRRLIVPAVALTLALSACGGGSSKPGTVTVTGPVASAPDAKAPPTDATQPGTGPVTAPKAKQAPGAGTTTTPSIPSVTKPKGAGNEEPVRVPATYTVRDGKLTPPGVSVPPFLAIVVTVVSADAKPHRLVVEVPPGTRTLTVPAHGRVAMRIPGLRAGRYGILLDGRLAGGILVGGDAGP